MKKLILTTSILLLAAACGKPVSPSASRGGQAQVQPVQNQNQDGKIVVLSPTENEKWDAGQTYTVKWQGGKEAVSLYLIDKSLESSGASVSKTDQVGISNNTGSYNYLLGNDVRSGTYKVCIGDENGTGCSSYFSITNQTSNWKTYTNTEYGFELKYPQSWKVGTPNDGSIYFMPNNGQDASMSIYVFDKPISEAEKLMPVFGVPGRKIDSRTNISVNGVSWEKLVVEINQIVLFTYHNGKTFGVQYSTFEDISPRIISTFKFTKSKDKFTIVIISALASNPSSFLNEKVQIRGKLILVGKNYFTDPNFALTDGVNNFSVNSWLPLEVPPPMPGSQATKPQLMSDYLDKTVTLQGTVEQDDQKFFLRVTKAF